MAVEKAIRSILRDAGAVTALVGDRIYPVQRPQGSDLPAVVFQQISAPREHNVSGPIDLVFSRFQISCWSANYLAACQLADVIREPIDPYRGTAASIVIDHISVMDEGDMPQLSPDNDELELHGKRLDVEVGFYE